MNDQIPIQHVVLLRFPADLDAADDEAIRTKVAAWPRAMPMLTGLRFGSDLTGIRSQGYQYLLFTEFASEADLDTYRGHPVHREFLAWIRERGVETLAFDYQLDADTAHI
jgi:hypothetical protein